MNKRRFFRRAGAALLFLILVCIIWGGAIWFTASSARGHLERIRAAAGQTPLSHAAAQQMCADVQAADADLGRLATLLAPTRPLLPHLGFIPRLGDTLVTLGPVVDLAHAGTTFGAEACISLGPALPALDAPADQRARQAAALLTEHQPNWVALRAAAHKLRASWRALPAGALERGLFARFAPQARSLAPLIEDLPAAIDAAEKLLPMSDLLLGLSAPRRFIILGQNPFELRATGGFIGSLGEVAVSKGRIAELRYSDSAAFDVEAPPGSAMPEPYTRYLRASRWYLRDANWWADFPTSAATVEAFWELNGQQAVDGVLAFDLYALQEVVRALGGIEVPGYGPIDGEQTLEAVFSAYEARGSRHHRDKQFLGALVQATGAALQNAPRLQLPRVLAAFHRALDERHISVYVHDEQTARMLKQRGWDGSLRADAGDYLQVVDADLSYGDVQAFIDEQIDYQVQLSPTLAPLTATVTVTLTNRYDPWRAAKTAERIYGNCFVPETETLERLPGCYGDYIRFYTPASAAPLQLTGADSFFRPDTEANRAVVGAYVMLYPGESKTITLSYRHYGIEASDAYTLTVQKQAGTLARPLSVAAVLGEQRVAVRTDLWRDRQLLFGLRDGRLALLNDPGERHPHNSAEPQLQRGAFERGRAAWEHGRHAEALQAWRDGQALHEAVDWARGMMGRGRTADAQQLADALIMEQAVAARAGYLSGELAERRDDRAGAIAAYRRASELDPSNDAPRFALAMLHYAAGDEQATLAALNGMSDPAAFLRWRYSDLRKSGQDDEAVEMLGLLLKLGPDDPFLYKQLYEALLVSTPTPWNAILLLTTQAAEQFPSDSYWLVRRAEARLQTGDSDGAVRDLERATTVRPDDAAAWQQLADLRWTAQQDATGALAAYEQLRRLMPAQARGYQGAATVLLAEGRPSEAESLLRQGVEQSPEDAEIQLSLGALLLDSGRAAEAIPLLENAERLAQGRSAAFPLALGKAYERAGRQQEALGAYQRALQLDPGNRTAQDSVIRLAP